ncbi:hypothetical protein MRB53_038017 [Persea americana]|nr:hypothetical protein MRB53_038017 [Persea americana]
MIHDGEYLVQSEVINSAAHHSVHHLKFHGNYGQFLTLWDRIGGTYREPDAALFAKETKMSQETFKKQAKEADACAVEVEGQDDRVYLNDEEQKKQQ